MTRAINTAECETDFMECIDSLVHLLKFDEYTYMHSLNVANYAVDFARCLNRDIDESLFYYGGLLHDIGKIKINLELLYKKEKLTPKEISAMQKHAELGYKILCEYNMPHEIIFAAKLHHERIDGTGYPQGLSGGEIPFVTKVISICDVFDALISDRPYRKGYTLKQVIHIMSHSVGQFDEELLNIFINKVIKENFGSLDLEDVL